MEKQVTASVMRFLCVLLGIAISMGNAHIIEDPHEETLRAQPTIAIIGSGLAGLSAAYAAAQKGKSSRLLRIGTLTSL